MVLCIRRIVKSTAGDMTHSRTECLHMCEYLYDLAFQYFKRSIFPVKMECCQRQKYQLLSAFGYFVRILENGF